jgi:hypothetical protein
LIEVGFIEWGLGKGSVRKVCKNRIPAMTK